MKKRWQIKKRAAPLIGSTAEFFKKRITDTSNRMEMEVPRWRFFIFVGVVLIVVVGFFVRLGYLQVMSFSNYATLAQQVRTQVEWRASPRGNIYDKSGTVLASNEAVYSLTFVPARLPEDPLKRQQQILRVVQKAELPADQIRQIIEGQSYTSFEPVVLLPKISAEKASRLQKVLSDTSAFRVQKRYARTYESPYMFSHVLGYVASGRLQPNGKTGIEKKYDQELLGKPGKTEVTVTATGEATGSSRETTGKQGNSVFLSLDKDLQEKLYEELNEQIKQLDVKEGAAVAMDPQTGAIRALVSIPGFDSSKISRGLTTKEYSEISADESRPFFNRAISGQYPPGSTIKPVVGLAALEENVIDPQKEILVTGQISVPSVYNSDIKYVFHDWKRHGLTDFVKAIAVSSNVYFYTVGGGHNDIDGLGPDRLITWFRKLGLGQKTGIDLPGESSGLVPTPEWKRDRFDSAWYIGDTYNISIGQGNLSATPLQVATYTSAVANGGFLLEPFVANKITTASGETVSEFGATIRRDVTQKQQPIELVQKGMRQAVLRGSVSKLQSVPVPVAGKTGTSQVSSGAYHGWFTGYAPYESPELAITVLVEHGGGGATAAVPVAERVLNWYFNR